MVHFIQAKYTRYLLAMSFFYLTDLSIHPTDKEEDSFFEGILLTQKHYRRRGLFEKEHYRFFKEEADETIYMSKAIQRLYDELKAQRSLWRRKSVQTWLTKLQEDNYTYLKNVIFPKKKKVLTSKLSIKKQLQIKLFFCHLKQKIIQKQEWHYKPHTWKYGPKVVISRTNETVIDIHLPGTKNRLGRVDEEHGELDEKACIELIRRLKDQKLYVEISEGVFDHFVKTGEYKKEGKNSFYIFCRHVMNKDTNNDYIVPCDYRYTEPIFTTCPFRDGTMILQLIYDPKKGIDFFQLSLKNILDFNKGAEAIVRRFKTPLYYFEDNTFNEIYEAQYRYFYNQLSNAFEAMSVIDDLLQKKNKTFSFFGHKIKDIVAFNTNFRERMLEFANAYLEIRIYDEIMNELSKDTEEIHGGVNLKEGAAHGFKHHQSMLDALWSDDLFLKNIQELRKKFPTPVEQRYVFHRLQNLLDQGRVRNIKITTSDDQNIGVEDILSPVLLEDHKVALIEAKEPIDGKNIIQLPFEKIVSITFEERNTSYRGEGIAGLMGLGFTLALSGSWWNRQKRDRETKKSKGRKMSNQDIASTKKNKRAQ